MLKTGHWPQIAGNHLIKLRIRRNVIGVSWTYYWLFCSFRTDNAYISKILLINFAVVFFKMLNREFYWANYATGLGASLHELGHTFDLAHTPSGIMARGFDDLHKVFTVQRSKEVLESRDNHACNHELSPNYLSASEMIESEVQQKEVKVVSLEDRRYKDICYGSPFKRVCFFLLLDYESKTA